MTPTRPRFAPRLARLAIAAALLFAAGGALGQVLPTAGQDLGGLPDAVGGLPGAVTDRAGAVTGQLDAAGLDPGSLADLRRLRQDRLLRANRKALDVDDQGQVVVRDEVLAIAPTPQALAAAKAAGFVVARQEALADLGLTAVVLTPPKGQPARKALKMLREMDPAGAYDLNHLYADAGTTSPGPARPAPSPAPDAPPNTRVGLLDGGVAAGHPVFAGARVTQQAFASATVKPSNHGTAVASLLVGRQGGFHGAAPGAALYAADVYGGQPAGGSAAIIARALAWMAREHVPVVNISLVGPPNALLQAAVAALVKRGVLVVAAVGNDGPAAPPLYPAAYPGVVAVTGVGPNRRVLLEASRGAHTDFAAPGSEMAAAGLQGFVVVRGTSFASPLVAGRLAALAATGPDALRRLAAEAVDLGAPGRDPVFGAGLVGEGLRTAPAAVSARPWKGD